MAFITQKVLRSKAGNRKQIVEEIEQIISRLQEIKEVLLADEPETEKSLLEQVSSRGGTKNV